MAEKAAYAVGWHPFVDGDDVRVVDILYRYTTLVRSVVYDLVELIGIIGALARMLADWISLENYTCLIYRGRLGLVDNLIFRISILSAALSNGQSSAMDIAVIEGHSFTAKFEVGAAAADAASAVRARRREVRMCVRNQAGL